MESNFPCKVSWRVYDAWLANPSCSYNEESSCNIQCPYFHECHADDLVEYIDDDEDLEDYD